jgi:hypothetical protein
MLIPEGRKRLVTGYNIDACELELRMNKDDTLTSFALLINDNCAQAT